MNPLTIFFCISLSIFSKKILFPNGLYAINILYSLAKKEFGNAIGPCRDYIVLKNEIIKSLKKEDPQKIKDKKFCTLVAMEHLKEHNFANYISVKFSYWSIIIATIVLFFGDKIVEYCTQYGISEILIAEIIIFIFTSFLLIMARSIHSQQDCMEYYKFKLMCFEEIENSLTETKKGNEGLRSTGRKGIEDIQRKQEGKKRGRRT